MSKALVVSIPHQLGRAEAERRIKSGLATVRTHYSALFHIQEENWTGDRLLFNISTLGQSASGLIDFADDHVRLEVTLPWLLALIAEKLTPAIRKEATLMLEKKGAGYPGIGKIEQSVPTAITLAFVARHAACAPASSRSGPRAGPPRPHLHWRQRVRAPRCRPDARSGDRRKRGGPTNRGRARPPRADMRRL